MRLPIFSKARSSPAHVTASYAAPSIGADGELEQEVAAMTGGDEPIIVGPWLSEVGYELLYWIPFVQWLVGEFQVDPKRLVAVSRGGASSWYRNLTPRYCDVFEFFSGAEFTEANEARQRRQDNSIKQFHLDDFDKQLAGRVAGKLGLGSFRILHPYLMYRTLNPYWAGQRTLAYARSHLKFQRFSPPESELRSALPSKYVAAKFYSRGSFPADDSNLDLVRTYLLRLSARIPVVIMDHQFSVDEHASFATSKLPNVICIGDRLSLSDNLAAQTAVVAGAEMVIGTYGGFTYLPLLVGRPAIGLLSHGQHMLSAHAAIVFAMADELGGSVSVIGADALRHLIEP